MKIDDPKVQKYISGDLSTDEEAALKEQLSQYPEVADLAETLKRTQALINEDKATDQVPDIAKAAPSSLQKTFEPMMGKNWKLELAMISGTVLVLFLVVLIPIVKSLTNPEKEQGSEYEIPEEEDALKQMEKDHAKQSSTSTSGSSGRASSGGGESAAFSSATGFNSMVTGEAGVPVAIEEKRFMAQQTRRLSGARVLNRGEAVQLATQVDLDRGFEAQDVLKAGEVLGKDEVLISELVNSLSDPVEGLDDSGRLQLILEGSEVPWEPGRWVLSVTLASSPENPETLANPQEAFLFLGLEDSVVNYFKNIAGGSVGSDLPRSLKALTEAGRNHHLVVFLARDLTGGEALLLKRWMLKPQNTLSFVDVKGGALPALKKSVGPESEIGYLAAGSPFLLKKAFAGYAALRSEPIDEISLKLNLLDSTHFSIEAPMETSQISKSDDPIANGWMFRGDQVTHLIYLDRLQGSDAVSSPVIEAKLRYKMDQRKAATEELAVQVLPTNFSGENSKRHLKTLALTWVGLLLKGEREFSRAEFTKLKTFAEPIDDQKLKTFLLRIEPLYL